MLKFIVLAVTTLAVTTVLGGSASLNYNFGNRIIGGDPATIEEFPYQISLRSYSIPICGGTILNKDTILTAAHCTYGKTAEHLTIRAGSTSNEKGGQVIKVAQLIPHEKYSRLTQDYDVCILKLAEPLQFGEGVAPLPLQDQDVEVDAGTEAVISGWGRTQEGNSSSGPEFLRQVKVNVITIEDCRKRYSNRPVTDRMLCCSSNGKDSCQGDSGGPLFSNGKLIGVVSWGTGCGRPKLAGVYAKVSVLRTWIDQHSN